MGHQILLTDVSVAEYRPMIAKMWHPTRNGKVTPDRVMIGSDLGVWWKCPRCGGNWAESVRKRVTAEGVSHRGCLNPLPTEVTTVREATPENGAVRGRRPNYLIDQHPEITVNFVAEMNTIKVTEVMMSHKGRLWWNCLTCKVPYQATVASLRKGTPHRCRRADVEAATAKAKAIS